MLVMSSKQSVIIVHLVDEDLWLPSIIVLGIVDVGCCDEMCARNQYRLIHY